MKIARPLSRTGIFRRRWELEQQKYNPVSSPSMRLGMPNDLNDNCLVRKSAASQLETLAQPFVLVLGLDAKACMGCTRNNRKDTLQLPKQ